MAVSRQAELWKAGTAVKRSRDPRHTEEWRVKWKFLRVPLPFLEYWMPVLTRGELAVWLYIFRHSVGYSRDSATLKYSQIATGAPRKDGKRADHGTGLSIPGVRYAISALARRRLLYVTPGKTGANSYRCNWSLPDSALAPENSAGCYSTITPDDSTLSPGPLWIRVVPEAKCAGDKPVTRPRRKAPVIRIDNSIDSE